DRFSPPLATRIVELARIASGDRVLDVGTGTGIVARAAARAAAPRGEVLGVDLSTRMIHAATQSAASDDAAARATIAEMDAEHLTFQDRSFDVVTSLFALLHFPNPLAALREQHRVLVPGGRMVLAVGSRPPVMSLRGLAHRIAHVPKLVAQWRGRRLVAPMLLDELVERRFPERSAPEQSALADASRSRVGGVVRLIRDAGFVRVRTRWEGYEAIIARPEEFWEIQRTFSSIARKRLEGRAAHEIAALRDELIERCNAAPPGRTLVYPFAAFYVSAERDG
ncbi:MAG: methyltransferase domain-containing protein, partial [Gemmatimonadaceae bacterium]